MVISISGTHCTGKSTLIDALKKELQDYPVVFLKSSGRERIKNVANIKINESGDFFSQLYFMSRDITQLSENFDKRLVICDRSYLDTWVYSRYLYDTGKLTKKEYDVLEGMKESASSVLPIDMTFILKPSYDLVNEENRSMSVEFQKGIESLFDDLLNPYSSQNRVEILPDSDDERVKIIINFLKTKFSL